MVFHNGCTNLHSHQYHLQKYNSESFLRYLCSHLLLFLSLSISETTSSAFKRDFSQGGSYLNLEFRSLKKNLKTLESCIVEREARGWRRSQEVVCLFVCLAVLRKERECSFYQISKNCITILPKINQKKNLFIMLSFF